MSRRAIIRRSREQLANRAHAILLTMETVYRVPADMIQELRDLDLEFARLTEQERKPVWLRFFNYGRK